MTDTNLLLPMRTGEIRIHDAEGFAGMRKAGRLVAECLDMLVPEVKPGVTTAPEASIVRFAALGDADIDTYVASGEPFGKAGSYAIQGRAAAFISHLEGSYSAVMGLPLFETASLLRGTGLREGA